MHHVWLLNHTHLGRNSTTYWQVMAHINWRLIKQPQWRQYFKVLNYLISCEAVILFVLWTNYYAFWDEIKVDYYNTFLSYYYFIPVCLLSVTLADCWVYIPITYYPVDCCVGYCLGVIRINDSWIHILDNTKRSENIVLALC